VIRRAYSGDADAVRALVGEAYGHYVERIGRVPGPMRDDYDRRIAANQVWVLEEGGAIVGLVVLEDEPEAVLLENVAVTPAMQGKGCGRALIAFAEREAVRRGASEIRLYTNVRMVENIALYRRLGFVEVGRVREQGFERVHMAKLAKRLPEDVPE
jgi:ribosomal protein S18 acetylase RimI-like enzyme